MKEYDEYGEYDEQEELPVSRRSSSFESHPVLVNNVVIRRCAMLSVSVWCEARRA